MSLSSGLKPGAGSRQVPCVAIGADIAIAMANFIAAAVTGSLVMLTKGVHSLVNTGHELLLLIGVRRSQRVLEQQFAFGVQLGLFGRFCRWPGAEHPAPVGEVCMWLTAAKVAFDLSGPTACVIGTAADRAAIVSRLGPDPLRRDARPEVAFDRIRKSRRSIGASLSDQQVLCGVRNVYRALALFVAGIRPTRPDNK